MDIFSEKTILSVARLTALLRGVLEENFDHVWVQGEVSNFSLPSSGHLYFSLKDDAAQLRCVMFRSAARNLKFRPGDGMALIVRGRITVYDQRGEYQLVCEYLEPAGVGALQLAFEQLRERLAREGLFNQEHKRPLPLFPRRVGIVTSPTGAAVHDILNVLRRRFSSLEVLIFPVRVQGEGAAVEIARGIEAMNHLGEADVLIVGRGGGSLEDLWAFNEEVVARAVRHSRIPVISAVGHETDWTICDMAADLRAPTPSAAAELVIASSDELRRQVEALGHRLQRAIETRLALLRSRVVSLGRMLHDPSGTLGHLSQRLDDFEQRMQRALVNSFARRRESLSRLEAGLGHHSPARRAELLRQRLDSLYGRMERQMLLSLEARKQRFGTTAARLEVLSPLETLSRGYAIAETSGGRVISSIAGVTPGNTLRLRFRDGSAECLVGEVKTLGKA